MMKKLFPPILGIALIALATAFCRLDSCPTSDPFAIKKDTTVLFVGNSLTYTNDLPKLVADIAKSKGRKIKVEMLALANYALVDHLADRHLQKMIATKKYQYVIVQQGPSSQAEGKAMLLEAAPIIKGVCDANGARLAFFMVWPAYDNYYNFDGVMKNYTEAAVLTNSILCPVGAVWKDYIDQTKDVSYYSPDLLHPSIKGSQVAAEVIFNSLFK